MPVVSEIVPNLQPVPCQELLSKPSCGIVRRLDDFNDNGTIIDNRHIAMASAIEQSERCLTSRLYGFESLCSSVLLRDAKMIGWEMEGILRRAVPDPCGVPGLGTLQEAGTQSFEVRNPAVFDPDTQHRNARVSQWTAGNGVVARLSGPKDGKNFGRSSA
ncbi:hypothetical protein B0H10DRAFT_1961254 [Mycena sp. CBHHK59/15]|nr:hypothetical protein B0H10DRAFT_1961254 [Mycena sp. CBHHK59/15]